MTVVPGLRVLGTTLLEQMAAGEPNLPVDDYSLASGATAITGEVIVEHQTRGIRVLQEGEVLAASTQGSGGYGDVLERDPAAVMEDLRTDAIRDWTARNVFCVAYDAETLIVDEEGTRALRAEHRKRRLSSGRPYAEFAAEWEERRPPEQVLKYFGEWPFLSGAEPADGRADLIGRERFSAAALGGEGVAFAPYVWEHLAEFVHQPATDWWRDGTTARRLLVDAASLAGADAMVVDACGEALRAVAAGGPGVDVLDGFVEHGRGAQRVRAYRGARRVRAVRGGGAPARPRDARGVARRRRARGRRGGRGCAQRPRARVPGGRRRRASGHGSRRRNGGRRRCESAGVAKYYGRPLLAVAAGSEAWVEGRDGVDVRILGDDGAWPTLSAGVVLTEDLSKTWDAAGWPKSGAAHDEDRHPRGRGHGAQHRARVPAGRLRRRAVLPHGGDPRGRVRGTRRRGRRRPDGHGQCPGGRRGRRARARVRAPGRRTSSELLLGEAEAAAGRRRHPRHEHVVAAARPAEECRAPAGALPGACTGSTQPTDPAGRSGLRRRRLTPGVVERSAELLVEGGKSRACYGGPRLAFIANRLQYALIREALQLLEDGVADAETIDAVITECLGPRWAVVGPLRSSDLAGIDTVVAVAEQLYAGLSRVTEPQRVLRDLQDAGRLGARAGRGFHD